MVLIPPGVATLAILSLVWHLYAGLASRVTTIIPVLVLACFCKEPFMTPGDESCATSKEIRDSFARLRTDIPDLKVIADTFEQLFLEMAEVREKLPATDPHHSEIDPVRFGQGVPVLKDRQIDVPRELFLVSADSIIPSMKKCFPSIEELLDKVLNYLHICDTGPFQFSAEGQPVSDQCSDETGDTDIFQDPELLQFITTLITKPFAEKISDALTPLPSTLNWTKGYCPVCGSWPEISFIKGKDGKRSLRCSFCAHEWSFPRLVCPFCENDDQTKLELFYSEDRSFERAELCHSCKKYIVGLDTRNLIFQPADAVAAIGMIYLDILAQEKGFTPGAICAWNVIDSTRRNEN